jgi:guanine deaminase
MSYYLGVDTSGNILFFSKNLPENTSKQAIIELDPYEFIIPGFVDTHIHAPQYTFTGTGYDKPLLEWLNTYTFPQESKFSDIIHAKNAYTKVVKKTLSCGTTTACYFATIHLDASKILVDVLASQKQRAFVGKVNMDRNSPDYYIENMMDSIRDTQDFVNYTLAQNNQLITPIITPRFVPTCTSELMHKLGEIAQTHNLPIQSHVSENKSEIDWVKSLHPECDSYSSVYLNHNLLNSRTVMAHCIHLTDKERALFKEHNVGISHCANSNFSLVSGVLNARRLLNEGHVKIGLGTDVGGGYSPSILDAIRQAIIASKTIYIQDSSYTPLNIKEAFYMATLGGATVLGRDSRIGNFIVGKAFDALRIKVDTVIDVFPHDDLTSLFEKFLFLGDDRNIKSVFVNGEQIV